MWHVFSITFLDCQRYLRDWTLTLAIGTWAKDWNCQAMRLCPAGQWRKNGAVLQEDALSTGIAFRALKCQFVELLWLLSSVGAVRPRMFLWNINRLWAQSTVCLGMWSTTLWTWWCAKFTDYDYAVWAFSSAWIQQCFTEMSNLTNLEPFSPTFTPPMAWDKANFFARRCPCGKTWIPWEFSSGFWRRTPWIWNTHEHSPFSQSLSGEASIFQIYGLVCQFTSGYSLKWPLHHTRSSSRNAS
jgi:hypothetical protein